MQHQTNPLWDMLENMKEGGQDSQNGVKFKRLNYRHRLSRNLASMIKLNPSYLKINNRCLLRFIRSFIKPQIFEIFQIWIIFYNIFHSYTPENMYSNTAFDFTFKGGFAKNEREYRLKSKNYQWWTLWILLLSVNSIRRKLLKWFIRKSIESIQI